MHTRNILVVGGAGFIGSHMLLKLTQKGYRPIVFDNLSNGNAHSVGNAKLIVGDMGDKKLLAHVFSAYRFHAVMHFASLIEVADSVVSPNKYYVNNVAASLNLFDLMVEYKVNKLVFSSSAAVYGGPQCIPINEDHPLNPINPYGKSKHMLEQIISDYANAYDLRYATLRYFNAAGADSEGNIGEQHIKESHLIPLILKVAMGESDHIMVNGCHYATIDGTCVRDYIHVNDICDAHLCVLNALENAHANMVYNVGIGQGYSIYNIIEVVEKITAKKISIINGPMRLGDPAVLIADASRIKHELGWKPQYGLEAIIKDAWHFMLKHANTNKRAMCVE